jgi:HAD superfamily hydrolase (TIGR01484 family)
MNRMIPTRRRALHDRAFVLATDLDGTFLGGSDSDRRRLYRWIEDNRRTIGLVFVTGRDPDFIAELTAGEVPTPDYVVGDVGTTIAHVGADGTVEPIAELEAEIAAAWADAGGRVRDTLDGHPGLTLQPTDFRYRVSFDYDPDAYEPGAEARVRDMGLDVLISDNRYFDVLPRGVSKGPSLRRLLNWLKVEEHRVLAAGDTLNDLSMLVSGLPAVAVGGSERRLLDRVASNARVHCAAAHGAGGILEAVAAFDLHPTPKGD